MVNHPNRSKAKRYAEALDEIRGIAASADWDKHSRAELFNLLTDIYHSADGELPQTEETAR